MSKVSLNRAFRKTAVSLACAFALGGVHASVFAEDGKLNVVASFSILADMVANVGGDDIVLSTIVNRDADAHGFEPTPKDARKLSDADLLIVNGLAFEAWLPRLAEASGFKGKQIAVSQGVQALTFGEQPDEGAAEPAHGASHEHDQSHQAASADEHGHSHAHVDSHDHAESHQAGHEHDEHRGEAAHAHDHEHSHAHGSEDPHAWQNPANAIIYVQNIAQALTEADPDNAASYRSRAEAYVGEIRQLDAEIRQALKSIPEGDRTAVTSHDAFGYFAQAYGVRFYSAVGVSSQAEASARDVAGLIDQVRKENIRAVFVENVSNPRLVEQIARETGAKVGGTLYSDALAPEGQPADTYLGMMRWNADQILQALKAD